MSQPIKFRLRRQHRRLVAVPGRPHHYQHPHGLRAVGRSRRPGDLRTHRRLRPWQQVVELSTATIRAVAQGVIGVAFIQAIIVGLALLVAGVPWAGALAAIMLVLGIAGYRADRDLARHHLHLVERRLRQRSGHHHRDFVPVGHGGQRAEAADVRTGLMPMPVILLGALGGMATAGILGMFVGATLLALGYQIFMGWVAARRTQGRVRRKATRHRRVE